LPVSSCLNDHDKFANSTVARNLARNLSLHYPRIFPPSQRTTMTNPRSIRKTARDAVPMLVHSCAESCRIWLHGRLSDSAPARPDMVPAPADRQTIGNRL